jgi:outer membrane protein OmpA-like peptidoglycan-associated protein
MKARIVLPISAGFVLLAAVLALQISPVLRGGDRSAPHGAQAAVSAMGPAAVKVTLRPAEDDLSNDGDDGNASGTAFLAFTFNFDEARIRASDKEKAPRAAAYVAANPSSRIGLDGHGDPNGNGLRNQSLMEQRVAAVRDALIRAGVPSENIRTGKFAESQSRRDREVAVVIIAAPKSP